MRRITKVAVATVALTSLTTLGMAGPVAAKPGNGNGNIAGTQVDALAPALGGITYLFNNAGYHFWFTATADVGEYYEAGDSYHNVYKYAVDDPENWCGLGTYDEALTSTIPNRAPYNLGGTAGTEVYYKIWNVTDGVYVCGSESIDDPAL